LHASRAALLILCKVPQVPKRHSDMCEAFLQCFQEVDPNPENARLMGGDDESSFLTDLAGSIPGIDEAMSFAEVMRQV